MLPSCGLEFEQRVKQMATALGCDQIKAWRILMLDREAPRARAVYLSGKPDVNPEPYHVLDFDGFKVWMDAHTQPKPATRKKH